MHWANSNEKPLKSEAGILYLSVAGTKPFLLPLAFNITLIVHCAWAQQSAKDTVPIRANTTSLIRPSKGYP